MSNLVKAVGAVALIGTTAAFDPIGIRVEEFMMPTRDGVCIIYIHEFSLIN